MIINFGIFVDWFYIINIINFLTFLGVSGMVNVLIRLICIFIIIVDNLVWESTFVRKKF